MNKETIRRWFLITVGVLSVGSGMVGLFLPLLPTTPFLLLAAACFVRSSPRLYDWLLQHPWFGEYIRHYREHRAITLQAKILTLTLLWSVIALSAVAMSSWWIRGLLGVVACGVTAHLLHLKTLTPEMLSAQEERQTILCE